MHWVRCLLLLLFGVHSAIAAEPSLEVVWSPNGGVGFVPGVRWARVLVMFSRHPTAPPMRGPNWFQPEPFFGVDLTDFSPGDKIVLDATSDGFPAPLDQLPAGRWRVQAVLHQADTHSPADGAGNWHSDVYEWNFDPQNPERLQLVVDRPVSPPKFDQNSWRHEIAWQSPLLSQFHGPTVTEYAAVVLPAGYDEQPQRRYPVVYIIPGFGGSHRDALSISSPPKAGPGEEDMIRVFLSGDCQWGHHVYADSETNGPRGAMLIEELIPHIDATFRTVAAPHGRFVTGHSSGGWSSLWLQVRYPDTFGGVWSTSPDPVDFRDFQQIDLYADPPQSMFVDPAGNRRPIARRGTTPMLWYDDFSRMDDVLGRGGQLRSFEAVFSPRGTDGLPRKLWNRQTGEIDRDVALAWEAYDIRLRLERNWDQLGPKLQGKLHIAMGTLDTFYLEGATFKLRDTLQTLGSDAEFIIVEGASHSSLLTPELYARFRRQMSETFRAGVEKTQQER